MSKKNKKRSHTLNIDWTELIKPMTYKASVQWIPPWRWSLHNHTHFESLWYLFWEILVQWCQLILSWTWGPIRKKSTRLGAEKLASVLLVFNRILGLLKWSMFLSLTWISEQIFYKHFYEITLFPVHSQIKYGNN